MEGRSRLNNIISNSNPSQIYVIFIAIDIAAVGFTYFFFPEFKNLSLEEIDLVFETLHSRPVKVANKLQKAKKEKRQQAVSSA